MAVKHLGEIYLCKVCGNEVEVVGVGGGTLVCCGRNMERKVEKSQTTTVLPENLPDSGE
ncbi:desulfoferrodoxin FeS4 iron-binding domain-containing protein [Chloroflexota bacterium]